MSAVPVTPHVIPPRDFKRNLPGYIRSAKAGHDVLIGSKAPEVRLVRVSAETRQAHDAVQIAPDLLAQLIATGAEAAAARVAEAQCAEADISQPLKQGLGDTVAQLLSSGGGTVWASLYVRSFSVFLHKLEFATALPHISLSALLAHLAIRIENDQTIPAALWQELQDHIFGRPNMDKNPRA